jgi:hypothetical protein
LLQEAHATCRREEGRERKREEDEEDRVGIEAGEEVEEGRKVVDPGRRGREGQDLNKN